MTHSTFGLTLLVVASMSNSLPAADESTDTRPANVRAAFEKMEAADAVSSPSRFEGQMGKKIPAVEAISEFRQRVAKRPDDFRSMTVLGQLYIRLARETGSHAAYLTAEKTLREALKVAPNYPTARTWLAVSLAAQHRFREALKLATAAFAQNSRDSTALAAIGDCELHLGSVAAAQETFNKLTEQVGDASPVLARHAQIAELKGDPDRAVALLESARDSVRLSGTSSELVAWYDLRLATVHHRAGHADDARMHYRTALELDENLHAARIGLARLIAEQGDVALATDLLKETIDASSSAAAMIVMGDVLIHQGKHDTASMWYDQAEAVLLKEMQNTRAAHQRDLSIFYCNRSRKLPEALALAKQDLKLRSDI